MIRAATDPALRLPTVSSASTTIKGILASPWELTTALPSSMPGANHTGPLPPMTPALAALAAVLGHDVSHLALNIGERNIWKPKTYEAARAWLAEQLRSLGLAPTMQAYDCDGHTCVNISADLLGTTRPEEIVVIGSHYDSLKDSPAANDNGSGCAVTLAMARRLCALPSDQRPSRTVRFVFFANEEPPFFWTPHMGSRVAADASFARREKIVAMITPETIGAFSGQPGSQFYPLPGLGRLIGDPQRIGNYIAFIGVGRSAPLVKRCVGLFREHAAFPSMGTSMPSIIPGVGASDHWSYWRHGYPALMVTDTAPFRYRYYHTREDLPDKIDFEAVARVTEGLFGVAASLARVDGDAG